MALTKMGTGTETLNGANTYSGPTKVMAGTLKAGAPMALSSKSDVTVMSTLDLAGNKQMIGALSGNGKVTSSTPSPMPAPLMVGATNNAGTFSGVIQDGAGQVALTKMGTGTQTLSGANTYSGATMVMTGTLQAGAAMSLSSKSDVTVMSTLDLNGNKEMIGALSGSGMVTSSTPSPSAAPLVVGATNNAGNFSGVIQDGAGQVALTKMGTGTQTLSGANTYSGPTMVMTGTLQAGAAMSLSSGVGCDGDEHTGPELATRR